MDLSTFKCPLCDKYETQNLNSLRIHAQKQHKLAARDLYLKLFLNCEEPKCACGCGKVTKFLTLQRGFAKYVRGHYARVHNNWGHNKEALKKSQDIRREMHKRGEITVWNKGQTTETDERIADLGRKCSNTIMGDPHKLAVRAERMRTNRLNGTIPTLKGEKHSQWKGGTSTISARCHGSHKLFKYWKYPKLKAAGFKCQRCGNDNHLQVHHNGERMADIIHRFVTQLNPEKMKVGIVQR